MKIGPTVRRGRRIEKKGQDRTGQSKKSQRRCISPIWGQAPTEPIFSEICPVVAVHDVITCANVWTEIFRGYDFTGVEFPIFLLILAWALQQCSTNALWLFSCNGLLQSFLLSEIISVLLALFATNDYWNYFIRPPDILVGGLGFYRDSIYLLFSFALYPQSSLNGTQPKLATCSDISPTWKCMSEIWGIFYPYKSGAPNHLFL